LLTELLKKRAARRSLLSFIEQAFGEAVEPQRLDRLARYEVHLDRKFERTVAMLLKLRELRATARPG
jgi:hypothetical protein